MTTRLVVTLLVIWMIIIKIIDYILAVKDNGELRPYILNPILKVLWNYIRNNKLPIIFIINCKLV